MKVHSLPISVSDLPDRHIVESERLELKAGWNPAAIMRSVGAFATDFQNLGGGYVLIGTEARDVHPAFKAPVEAPVKVPVAEGVSLNNTERKILLLSEGKAWLNKRRTIVPSGLPWPSRRKVGCT